MTNVLIALGSNLGNRQVHLARAKEALGKTLEIAAVSRLYETEPMYVVEQPSFLNAALLAKTDLGPLPLLRLLKATEAQVGRHVRERNGPREIDLDLISYGCIAYRFGPHLEVPHPRVAERAFVLRPLADLDPHLILPGLGSVAALLEQTTEGSTCVVEWEHA